MTLEQIKLKLLSEEYDFLRNDAKLKDNIGIITLGGSHAYGTSNEGSDLDIRGMIVPTAREIILNTPCDQFENRATDTVFYNLSKLFNLLSNCNPNTIEMLGNKPEHYLYVSKYGQMVLDNTNIFLSNRCINSFGGYANAQLRRLDNKCARSVDQSQREQHILNTINNAKFALAEKYDISGINLYIDKSNQEGFETEIYMDADLSHYPLRDYVAYTDELRNIVRSYEKEGMRNSKAAAHDKLGKHMMHLVRLYLMGLDLLEKGQIITSRDEEHDLLMDIRNELYLDENDQPTSDFRELLNDLEKRFDYAKANSVLPDKPNYKKIEELQYSIYHDIIASSF